MTSNKVLAQRSRRYLIEQRIIQPQHCPPILSVGQITTIAWLIKDKSLAPEKAGRELLSNCFAAVRPDQDWFRYFREGIEKVTGSVEEFVKDPKNGLTLQAARRIAQEESFGNSAVVRELNMVEILKRAEDQYAQISSEKETQAAAEREAAALEFDRIRREAEASRVLEAQTAIAERNAAVQAATEAAGKEAQSRFEAQVRSSAYRKADRILNALKIGLFVLFLAAALPSTYYELRGERSDTFWGITIFLFLVNVFDIMDLMKIRFAERIISPLRDWIASLFMA